MSLQGFAVTAAGRNLFAKLTARSEPAEFTRVMFGTGKLADNEDIFNVTELVAPLAEGTSTTPEYKDDTVSMILEFRSDLNGGLTETVWLNEYGLYVSDPDGGEVLVCYGNLGDCPDSVLAFKDGQCTVRDYPISIVIGAVSDVSIDFPAAAFVTWEELKNELAKKADASHTHSADDITSGTLAVERGGNGGYILGIENGVPYIEKVGE